MPAHLVKPGHRGGGKKCAVCALPAVDREKVEGDLAMHVPLLKLERRWGISRSALRAHRGHHISPALTALRTERALTSVRKVADRIEDLVVETDKMYQSAKKVVNMPMALRAVREQRDNYELLAKVTGELDDRPQVTVNIQQSAAFIAVRSVIFEVLEPHPQLRAEISRRLRVLADSSDTGGASQ
jgi:hypothetical protein